MTETDFKTLKGVTLDRRERALLLAAADRRFESDSGITGGMRVDGERFGWEIGRPEELIVIDDSWASRLASLRAATRLHSLGLVDHRKGKRRVHIALTELGAAVLMQYRSALETGEPIRWTWNEATLSTVPRAQTANSSFPAEAWHEVGSPGEPSFQNRWKNKTARTPAQPQTVAFYKDREGVVHLKGLAGSGVAGTVVFQLPVGYRPASGTFLMPSTGLVRIYGSDTQIAGLDGAVEATETPISLDSITFRAES